MLPVALQTLVDSAFKRIHRMPFYYERYNNTLGFGINRRYTRYARECSAVYKAKTGSLPPPSPLLTKAAALLKNVYPADRARAASQKISDLITENNQKYVLHPVNKEFQVIIKEPLTCLGADLLDVLKNPDVDGALQSFFQGFYRVQWAACYRTIPTNRTEGSWMWHSDSYPPYICRIFLHLTPADADTGATHFMDRRETMAFRRAGYFGQYLDERYASLEDFARQHDVPYRPYILEAQPGDATLFNMNYFHKAVAPKKGFRDVIQIQFLPNAIPWHEQLARDGIGSLHTKGGFVQDPHPGAASASAGNMM